MSTAPEVEVGPKYVLRLYITGTTPRSLRAIANLRQILSTQPAELFDLQVIDIYQQPEAASEYQIIAAPTLVKLSPEPVRRIIGDLSDNARVLKGLEIEPAPSEAAVGEPDRE
ncbi:circadian clock KaiB family protein [Phenylobacterium sp.]|uniref:circadian clock KaiB family protein n=1 Tax=Phenylobacterium sp. TaxID=1871053 RepID=UPI002DE32B60|nr:circadian clock KaiB family protein [Phenylobacterium sp.]